MRLSAIVMVKFLAAAHLNLLMQIIHMNDYHLACCRSEDSRDKIFSNLKNAEAQDKDANASVGWDMGGDGGMQFIE